MSTRQDMPAKARKYDIDFRVTGYKSVHVVAADYDEAVRLASEAVCDADFGELENIEWEQAL